MAIDSSKPIATDHSIAGRSYRAADLHAEWAEPLILANHGFFWTGIERVVQAHGTVVSNQMYVEFFIPAELTQPWPIVMVHGGGGQGLDYLGTADGRPGWVNYFVRLGYAVYVVDRPGHGRAPYDPDCLGPMRPTAPYEFIAGWFANPAQGHPAQYPQAKLHTQWPGNPVPGDPCLDSFVASGGPAPVDMERYYKTVQVAGAELLDKIGPVILMTHSAGGPCGWMIADARPDQIKAIIAIEPYGPPVTGLGRPLLPYGLSAAALTYDPPVTSADDLSFELRQPPHPDLVACYVQVEPARQLPNLQGYPIVVVTAQASWMATDNHGTVDYLAQAGATVAHLRLEDEGVYGNGHALMVERNSDEAAAVLHGWIKAKGLAKVESADA